MNFCFYGTIEFLTEGQNQYPFFIDVHPAQTMNSAQMNATKATAIPFWSRMKYKGQHYTMITYTDIYTTNGHEHDIVSCEYTENMV
jgi:hypothetical protein